ncbi:hypothetical protein QBC37DRAFT_190361 [Rhypophila decipiens]|uniref:Uncharacterized protein n=1 Tax=Rhypophila decipiens TaxID=261697 RepID=A0AAN6YHL5_9PEZI|nr:hypothetical protein QBC37DRAFT_190361 [Rhypophila decipiens]
MFARSGPNLVLLEQQTPEQSLPICHRGVLPSLPTRNENPRPSRHLEFTSWNKVRRPVDQTPAPSISQLPGTAGSDGIVTASQVCSRVSVNNKFHLNVAPSPRCLGHILPSDLVGDSFGSTKFPSSSKAALLPLLSCFLFSFPTTLFSTDASPHPPPLETLFQPTLVSPQGANPRSPRFYRYIIQQSQHHDSQASCRCCRPGRHFGPGQRAYPRRSPQR